MNKPIKNVLGGRAQKKQDTSVFDAKTVLLMILIGVFSFSAYFVLSAFSEDMRTGNNGGKHALSKSAVGYAGLMHILQNNGFDVDISREAALGFLTRGKLRIITPNEGYSRTDLDDLELSSPTLIVLPKWNTGPLPGHKGWVRKKNAPSTDTIPTEEIQSILEPIIDDIVLTRKRGTQRVVIKTDDAGIFNTEQTFYNFEQIQTISLIGLEPIINTNQGILVAKLPYDEIYILSDPDFLNSFGLAKPDIAPFAIEALEAVSTHASSDGYLFDLSLHGFSKSRNLIKLALMPPFLAVTLCLLAMALLLGWQALMRFGSPIKAQREFALGKLALIDNAARFIKRGGREKNFGKDYAKLNAKLVADKMGIPNGIGETELDTRLDIYSKHAKSKENWTQLLSQSEDNKDAAELMAIARKLFNWRGEITHERD